MVDKDNMVTARLFGFATNGKNTFKGNGGNMFGESFLGYKYILVTEEGREIAETRSYWTKVLDGQAVNSFTADCIVSDIFVPVSPSGTGNTLSASTFARFISSSFAPTRTILRNSVLLIVLGIEMLLLFFLGADGYNAYRPLLLVRARQKAQRIPLRVRTI